MSITKRDIINSAFGELGLGSYNYDMQPEDYETALIRLDGLMSEWASFGLQTGYPATTQPDAGSLDDAIGLIMPLREGVIAALAIRLAPGYGKTPSPDTKTAASKGWNVAQRLAFQTPEKYINTTAVPAGAGYKRRYQPHNLSDEGPAEILPGEVTR